MNYKLTEVNPVRGELGVDEVEVIFIETDTGGETGTTILTNFLGERGLFVAVEEPISKGDHTRSLRVSAEGRGVTVEEVRNVLNAASPG